MKTQMTYYGAQQSLPECLDLLFSLQSICFGILHSCPIYYWLHRKIHYFEIHKYHLWKFEIKGYVALCKFSRSSTNLFIAQV
jgi:hypothetical protein